MSEAKFLKLWEYVVSSISAFARDESGRTEAAFEHHEGKLMPEVIFKLPPATAKAWHKLVLRLQVPMRLGRGICQLLDSPWKHAAYVAMRAMFVLLQAAKEAGILSKAADSASGSSTRGPIALSIGQQLKESGVLQRMRALVTATARRLQKAAGVTPPPAAAAAGRSAQRPASCSTGSTMRQVLTADTAELLEITAMLLHQVCYQLSLLWPEREYYCNIAPNLMQPRGHLAVGLMQYLSARLQQAQHREAGVAPDELLRAATERADLLLSGGILGHVHGAEGIQHWMDCQPGAPNYMLMCACMLISLAATGGSLPPNLASASSSSSSSSSICLTCGSVCQRHMSGLWQRCCSMTDAVPESCAAMLQLLTVSKETALWAAAQAEADLNSLDLMAHAVHMAQSLLQIACIAQQEAIAAHQHSACQASQAMLPYYWQLPTVGLLWASQHPTGTVQQDRQYVEACEVAIKMSFAVMVHALRLHHAASGHQPSSSPMVRRPIDESSSMAPVPTVFLEVVLLQFQILSQLVQLQHESVAGAVGGGSAQGSSSSSNSRGALPQVLGARAWPASRSQPGSSAQFSADAQSVFLTQVVDMAGGCLRILAPHTCRSLTLEDIPASQVAAARQLCTAFEHMIRGQFEALHMHVAACMTFTGELSTLNSVVSLLDLTSCETGGWVMGPLVDPVLVSAEPKAVQLFGLLCSMLKAAGYRQVMRLLDAIQSNETVHAAPVAWQYAQVAIEVAGIVVVARQAGTGALEAARTLSMLPWLTLIGRGSVFLGDQLQAMTAAGQGTSAAAAAAAGVEATPAALVSPCQRFWQRLTPKVLALGGAVQKICEGSSAAHLARAGYNLQPLLEQLDSMTAALGQTVGASDTQPAGQLQALQVQLSAFGGLLTALAHPYACNNPDCAYLSGASELRLVSGPSTKCSGCKTARYCCNACQVQHWQRHKPVCKALAAAAAGAS